MKTYAPKDLGGADLRQIMVDLGARPIDVAKFLAVTERSVWRWLADGTAPRAVLVALWHETAHGREVTACDVGNELVLTRAGKQIALDAQTKATARLARLLAISDTGSANDPFVSGPVAPVFGGLSQALQFSMACPVRMNSRVLSVTRTRPEATA